MNIGQEKLGKHIEQRNDGYSYVGEKLVLCPVYEIGINVLERTESKLPYIYEVVLKLVNTGIDKTTDMCSWLGLDEGILSEIVSDMAATSRLIDVSQARIALTPKGKQALSSLKLIELQKSQLNEVYVNAVSGCILENPPARLMPSPPPRPYMYLDRTYILDLKFLNDRFDALTSIHQGQKRSDFGYYSKALFRILNIAYQDLHYTAMPAQVYVQNGTGNILVLFSQNREFDYSSVVYKQVQAKTNGATWLFERDVDNKKDWPTPIWTTESYERNLATAIDLYHSYQSGETAELEYASAYCSSRMLLSGEIDELLFSLDAYKTRQLIILSSHIMRYLSDDTLSDRWIPYLGNLHVGIYYSRSSKDNQRQQLDAAVGRLYKRIPESKKAVVEIREIDDCFDRTIIIANPGFAIGSKFEYIPCSSGDYLLKEVSGISFDPGLISKWLKLVREYIS